MSWLIQGSRFPLDLSGPSDHNGLWQDTLLQEGHGHEGPTYDVVGQVF
jgi:hypothetical protein